MQSKLLKKENAQRRLCIKKDLIEVTGWIDALTQANEELSLLKVISEKIIKNRVVTNNLIGARRNSTLLMGELCKYESELNTEYEYGNTPYDLQRAKEHEKKRKLQDAMVKELFNIKKRIYHQLTKYER